MKEEKLPEELIKKLKDTAIQKTQSDDVKLSKERREYRNLVLTAHANIENLLGLLIRSYFAKENSGEGVLVLLDTILEYIDYGTKIRILKDFGWDDNKEDKKVLDKALEIAKYRNAVAHLKKKEPRRLANEENVNKVKALEDFVEDKLLLGIVGRDPQMIESMTIAVEEYLSEYQQEKYNELKREALRRRSKRDSN